MAQLVLGTAGAIIGGSLFGPVGASVGWAVGAALGGLLDPPKVEGPRRTDLKLQFSTYGAPLPIFYGTVRAAGNVIDQSPELTEHKHTSGGKGGPKQTTYSYSIAYVAIALCATRRFGEPAIKGIRRIWGDNRLLSEDGLPSDSLPFVLYTGTEDQLPDPTIEAERGVGEVPAYRGTAYVVFTDWALGDFGDRVPSLEFEIEASGEPQIERVSTFYPTEGGNTSFVGTWTALVDGAYLDGSEVVVCRYTQASPPTYQEFRYHMVTGELVYTGPLTEIAAAQLFTPSTNSNIAHSATVGDGTWYVRGVRGTSQIVPADGRTDAANSIGRPFLADDGYVYCAAGVPVGGLGGDGLYIAKFAFDGTEVSPQPEDDWFDVTGNLSFSDTLKTPQTISVTVDDAGYVWAFMPADSSDGNLFKIDPADMSLVKRYITTGGFLIGNGNGGSFTVRGNVIAVSDVSAQPGSAKVYEIPDVVTDPFVEITEGPNPEVDPAEWLSPPGFTPLVSLGGGYIYAYDGIYRMQSGETLGNIVLSISELAGFDDSEIDVTDLTDPVLGYRISAQMTARNAIEPLRQGYFFDGAEVDDAIVFKHRDGTSVAEIDDADLAAHMSGTDAPPVLQVVRVPDHELPWRVFVKYINPDQAYETGTQYDERQAGRSQAETSLDLPIVLDDDSAKAIATEHVFVALIERERFTITTTRKYEKLVPTDVVTVQNRTLRIVDKRSKAGGVIEFDLLTSHAAPFIQPTGLAAPSTSTPATAPGARAPTAVVFLDIPSLYQTDPPFGFRVAMGPDGSGPWPGAALFKSYDNTTYTEVAASSTPDVFGVTAAVGSPAASGVVSVGGTLGVILTDPNAELESYTAGDILGGLGLFAVQKSNGFWNLFQYQTATLVETDPPTYELSGITLADKNDEDEPVTGHAAGDAFVLLPAVVVDAPESDLNRAIYYKAVTFGRTLSETPYHIFTNTGKLTESFYRTEANYLPEFFCEFGSPIGSPAIGRPGLVPAPTLEDCNQDRILSVHGWIDNTGGAGSPAAIPVAVRDQGVTVTSSVAALDFLGDDVAAAHLGNGEVSITITPTITTLSGGALVSQQADAVNFNLPLRAADAGGGVTNATIDTFTGADVGSPSPAAGARGVVPAPSSGDGLAGKFLRADATWATPTQTKSIIVACSDETTAITTGVAKMTFRMPYAITLTTVRASLNTASTSGTPTVDINVTPAGSPSAPISILSTKLTIDAGELTSVTAAVPVVISSPSISDDGEVTIDIDVSGTGAKGLKVVFIGT